MACGAWSVVLQALLSQTRTCVQFTCVKAAHYAVNSAADRSIGYEQRLVCVSSGSNRLQGCGRHSGLSFGSSAASRLWTKREELACMATNADNSGASAAQIGDGWPRDVNVGVLGGGQLGRMLAIAAVRQAFLRCCILRTAHGVNLLSFVTPGRVGLLRAKTSELQCYPVQVCVIILGTSARHVPAAGQSRSSHLLVRSCRSCASSCCINTNCWVFH